MNHKKIAIIGGGFSGVAVAYNLLQLSQNQELSIDIFDNESFKNNGKAYKTLDLTHILNVPADKMGLPFDDEEHFYKWLNKNHSKKKIDKADFAPRAFYRLYLQEIIGEIKKDKRINFISGEVLTTSQIDNNFTVSYKKIIFKKQKHYNHVVLACGLPIKKINDDLYSKKIINNIWQFFNQKHSLNAKTILIVGTGLTMIDMVLGLKNNGFAGKIIACSGNAKLPLPHSVNRTKSIPSLEITDAKLPLSKILQKLKSANKNAGDWQSIVHGLRPITQKFWQELGLEKQKRFIRHLSTMWNIHRHRMPKNSFDVVEKMIKENQLNIVKGMVVKAEEKNGKVFVHLKNQEIIEVDLVLNAMGFDFSGKGNVFLNQLMEEKIIEQHQTKLGFAVANNVQNFHLAGAFLTGELLEATAVPELRAISNQIAIKILNIN